MRPFWNVRCTVVVLLRYLININDCTIDRSRGSLLPGQSTEGNWLCLEEIEEKWMRCYPFVERDIFNCLKI
jgi:hypothetical protein